MWLMEDWLWGVAIALVSVNLLALASGLLARRTRWAWAGLLAAFYMGVINQGFLAVPGVVISWWRGGALLRSCGLSASMFGSDRETRLPVIASCTCDGREVQVPNTVLTLLHRYVRPAAGTWQGAIPELPEAEAILRARGVTLSLRRVEEAPDPRRGLDASCVWRGDWQGRSWTFWRCSRGTNPEADASWTPRVAPLEPPAILVAHGEAVGVWLPEELDDPTGSVYEVAWVVRQER